MFWEFCGSESAVKGRLDETCVQLVGGIAPLRVGQQARVCQDLLFCNPGEKTLTISQEMPLATPNWLARAW